MEENEMKLEEDLHRAEEFQKQAPTEPGQGSEPATGQSSASKKTEQEKTEQAAKVAQ